MEASRIDAFAEAEALVDEFGPRPPGSDAERRAAQHLVGRLEELGREAHLEGFSVWPQWATGYAINAGVAVVGGVLAVYSAALGTGIVLIALIVTFLDAAGITPTTRRLLGRRASQNVVSFGDREMPGALVLVAHYDSGPTRTRPLWPMFLAMVILLVMCVGRVAGMSGAALTVVQFLATVVLIVYVALMLDIALSPVSQGESDNASGVGVVLRLAERLTDLNYSAPTSSSPVRRRRGRRVCAPSSRPTASSSRPRDDRHQHRRRRRRRAPGDEEGGPRS
jgi:hypothetical protein